MKIILPFATSLILGSATLISAQVVSTTGIVWQGTYGQGGVPTTTTDPKMMWYPGKAAFRAGVSSSAALAADSQIGRYSFAVGKDSVAQGDYSASLGGGVATNDYAFAFGGGSASGYASFAGAFSIASGVFSAAWGTYSNAAGQGSVAIGWATDAHAYQSVSFGNNNHSWMDFSVTIGSSNNAGGYGSNAIGWCTGANGNYSTSIGNCVGTNALGSVALGSYDISVQSEQSPNTWRATDQLLIVGNGSSSSALSNAMVITKNGNTRFGGDIQAKGIIRCAPGGDISMGDFTSGTNPATLNAALKYTGE